MRDPLLYKVVRPIITVLFKIIYRPKYIGLENIPIDDRIVLGGNHTDNLDCLFIISSTKRVVHFLAKDSLIKGFKKVIFKNMGIIPVNRKIHDKNALKEAKEYLMNNKVIGIFPEGTINRTDDLLMPFKIGCVKMAYDTDAYIVPFIISGSYRIFNNKLTIEYLKPYKVLNDDLDYENDLLRKKISDVLEKRK